jgi:hypothetical protein
VYQVAWVRIESADPPLVVNGAAWVFSGELPAVGGEVRLLVPIHRPSAARIVVDADAPALTGPTVIAGRRRFPLGRWSALAGRPVWRAMSAERLLDQATELIGEWVLERHRRRCGPLAESLHQTPDFLALDAAFDVPWPTIVRRALQDQEDIYDATADSRAELALARVPLVFFAVCLAPVLLVVPDLVRMLWATGEALFAGSVRPFRDVVRWDAAVAAADLPTTDFFVVLSCLVVLVVALVRGLVRSVRRSRAARREWREDLTAAIRTKLRTEYQRAANSGPAVMNIRSAPGFAVLSADQVVPRAASAQLRGLAFELGAGAVAVSGSRGAGKTTLLRALTAGDDADALGIMVSAPVRYEPRDFLLHLYAQLCRTILDRLGDERARSRFRRAVSQARRFVAWLLSFAGTLGLLAVVFVGTRDRLSDELAFPRLPATYVILSLALAVVSVWVRGPVPTRELALAAEAAKRLRQTRFLQTLSAEHSAGAGQGPMQIGLRRARQWAEQPHSLPELVDSYRTFATEVAEWWRAETGGRGKVLIAVDEADRIADPLLAEQFVNEIKATFGVPHCVFLVSMSDEALAGFERRLLRLRTVFDSAFDHVVRLDALSVAESAEMLRHRVAGVPDAFWLLCHCLAGGMPRDVLRMARTMLDEHRGQTGPTRLAPMAHRLVASEVQAVKRAFLHETAADADAALRSLCSDADWPGPASGDIRRAAEGLLSDRPVAGCSLAAFFLYYALILDLFATPRATGEADVAAVTAVHRLLATDPAAAIAVMREEFPVRA